MERGTTKRGPDDWSRVKELLGDALERPRAERESFLDQRCARGSVIRAEVDRLLALDVDGDPFLEPLPAGALAPGPEDLLHDVYEEGQILEREDLDNGIRIKASLPPALAASVMKRAIKSAEKHP